MKKLTLVDDGQDINGLVIETRKDDSGLPCLVLNKYFVNQYGVYDNTEYELLDSKDFNDVLNQKGLAKRVKRVHYYFPKASYISESAVNLLSADYEDPDYDLKGVVIF